jgi:hypothetical protein
MKTTEVYFEELGYMSKSTCEKIKGIMDGKTYMDFEVSYSNYAGNCTLICSTTYEASESEIKNFFLSALIQNMVLSTK